MKKEWLKFILMWIITIILLGTSIIDEVKHGTNWKTFVLTPSGCLLPYLYILYKEQTYLKD